MKTIIKYLFVLVLLTGMPFIGDAFAQTTTTQSQTNLGVTIDDLKTALNPEGMSEYSASQYAAIFGCPGDFFKTSGGGSCTTTAFGVVVGQFNLIALIMGVIVVSYVIFGGAINTAASGEILGRNWSSTWLPIRTCMAFTLILPLSGTAPYSPAQMAALYAVVVGDNVATTAVKKITNMVAGKEVNAVGQMPKLAGASSIGIAGSVFCAANEWNALTNEGNTNKDTVLYTVDEGTIMNRDVEGNVAYAVENIDDADEIIFGSTGTCGSIALPELSWTETTYFGDAGPDEENKKAAYIAAKKLIIKELNYYQTLEKELRASGVTGKQIEAYLSTSEELPETVVAAINVAMAKFQLRAASFPQELESTITSSYGEVDAKSFLEREVVHYTDINKLLHKMAVYSTAPYSTASGVYNGLSNMAWDVCFAGNESCSTQLENEDLAEAVAEGKATSTMPAMKLMKKVVGNTKSNSFGIDLESIKNPEAALKGVGDSVKAAVLEGISATTEEINMDFSLNPMVYLHGIGESLLTLCSIAVVALVVAGVFGHNIAGEAAGLGGGLDVLMTFLGPIIMTLMTAAGAMLFVSVIPIIVGIYGYISIMVMAIQGVAAAPFAVVLLTSPEGQGGTNQTAQRFLLHLTHLFLAPLIYVLGALATLSILVVGANIAIFTFIYELNFFGSDSWLASIMSIVFFVWLLYSLVIKTSTYQLVFQNEVMQILGGGYHSPLAESMAAEGKAAAGVATNLGMKAMATQTKDGQNVFTALGEKTRQGVGKGLGAAGNKLLGRK